MEPSADDVRRYIADGLACEELRVDGDGRHFDALVVSSAFEGRSRVQRHQLVYAALGEDVGVDLAAASGRPVEPPCENGSQGDGHGVGHGDDDRCAPHAAREAMGSCAIRSTASDTD